MSKRKGSGLTAEELRDFNEVADLLSQTEFGGEWKRASRWLWGKRGDYLDRVFTIAYDPHTHLVYGFGTDAEYALEDAAFQYTGTPAPSFLTTEIGFRGALRIAGTPRSYDPIGRG